MRGLHDLIDAIISYFAAVLALVVSLPLMKIGGAILLIARLVVDVPPAFRKLKEMAAKCLARFYQ